MQVPSHAGRILSDSERLQAPRIIVYVGAFCAHPNTACVQNPLLPGQPSFPSLPGCPVKFPGGPGGPDGPGGPVGPSAPTPDDCPGAPAGPGGPIGPGGPGGTGGGPGGPGGPDGPVNPTQPGDPGGPGTGSSPVKYLSGAGHRSLNAKSGTRQSEISGLKKSQSIRQNILTADSDCRERGLRPFRYLRLSEFLADQKDLVGRLDRLAQEGLLAQRHPEVRLGREDQGVLAGQGSC